MELKESFFYLKGQKNGDAVDYEKSVQFFEANKTRNKWYNNLKIWVLLKVHYEHFVLVGDLMVLKYTENFHVLISRSKGFTEKEKRRLLNTNNTIKFLIKSRQHPDLSLVVIKTKIAKFKSIPQYHKEWITAQIEEFLTFRFPNISFD